MCRLRGQGVNLSPPLHDLAVLDGNDRDEAVVVGSTRPDCLTMDLVLENRNAGILRSVRDERTRAVEDDVVPIARIERHQRLAAVNSERPSWENVPELEHRDVGKGIEVMVPIDEAGQPLLDDVEERVECSKGRVLTISHNLAPRLSLSRANGQQHAASSLCQLQQRPTSLFAL